jgi:hypothetical protein
MSEEITGIDYEVTRIEEWQESCLAYDAAVKDKRFPPEIMDYPDGRKLMNQLERLSKEVERVQAQNRAFGKCCQFADSEGNNHLRGRARQGSTSPDSEGRVYKKNPSRPISAGAYNSLMGPETTQMVHVHLYLYGERRFTVKLPENTTQRDLRRRASQYFDGRVRTIVNCIPSFVPETDHPQEGEMTAIPCLVHHERKFPIEVWPNTTRNDFIIAASNTMNGPCRVHDSTTYPVKTDDEIPIAAEQEVRLIEIRFAALRKEEEAKIRAQAPPMRQYLASQAPSRATSREILRPMIAFQDPVPQSANTWGTQVKVTFRRRRRTPTFTRSNPGTTGKEQQRESSESQ